MYSIIKKSYPHLVAALIFVSLISVYFAPSIFQGRIIWQPDMQKVYGMATDINQYHKKGERISAWTSRMFSGMPSYQIRVLGNPPNYFDYLEKPIKAIDYLGASMLLTALICFYILMYVIGVKRWLAIAGAIAFAFTSYHLIIISVGHITKMYVIAYMPLTVAGMIVLFRKQWINGTILFLLGLCFSIRNGHIQITYYLFLFCLFIFAGFAFFQLKQKRYPSLIKITGIMALSIVFAVLASLGNLYADYEASQESTRSRSDLILSSPKNLRSSSGLDKEYAFSWSYGKGELLTLLIPNAYGGSSMEMLDRHSEFYKTYKSLGGQVRKTVQVPTYWGDQPFTEGPVYFGAVVCFLFILGMFIIQNPIKWWIAAANIFFIFLSLGKNCMVFNDFLFYHLPFYNKFRTPSMALVIPGMTFPLIGFWGLAKMISEKVDFRSVKKPLMYSFFLTGGICCLIWLLPSVVLNFNSPMDTSYFAQYPQLIHALKADREKMASLDAFRSFVFILLASIFLFFFLQSKNKKTSGKITSIGILVLITIDLCGIAKRYLNDRSFSKQHFSESYQPTRADRFILQDRSLSYRVLNLSVNTFNETHTSFFHQSIGGYHAAKLRRYQELIDYHILNEMNTIRSAFYSATTSEEIQHVFEKTPVLNMLNMRYLIYHPEKMPIVNFSANGNAWFVDRWTFVPNSHKEIEALHKINLKKTAVIHRDFAKQVKIKQLVPDSKASIYLTEYAPNDLKYASSATSDQLAVFSEIYYKNGWKSFIDQIPAKHFRTDWILRAMIIPAGKHTIEFRFEPDRYRFSEQVASIASLVILLGITGISIAHFKRKLSEAK